MYKELKNILSKESEKKMVENVTEKELVKVLNPTIVGVKNSLARSR